MDCLHRHCRGVDVLQAALYGKFRHNIIDTVTNIRHKGSNYFHEPVKERRIQDLWWKCELDTAVNRQLLVHLAERTNDFVKCDLLRNLVLN